MSMIIKQGHKIFKNIINRNSRISTRYPILNTNKQCLKFSTKSENFVTDPNDKDIDSNKNINDNPSNSSTYKYLWLIGDISVGLIFGYCAYSLYNFITMMPGFIVINIYIN